MRIPKKALQSDPAGIHAVARNLRDLIEYAYGIQDYQLTGGDHGIIRQPYNLDATTSAPATGEQLRLMLRGVLRDRFGVQLSKSKKVTPVVAAVVGPDGFKPVPPGPPPPDTIAMHFTSVPDLIGRVSPIVSRSLGRTLIDQTGLTGTYSISIYLPFPPGQRVAALDPRDILSALKKLGLELKPESIPLTIYTIESAHAPTPN